jgi:hypothetical protein
MIKTLDRTLTDEQGSVLVKSTQLPATRAFKLMTRLGKLLGPVLGQLKGVKLGSDTANLVPALGALFAVLEPDEADALMISILEGTLVVTNEAITLSSAAAIDKVFSGRLPMLLKVMSVAIEANFADFFRGLGPSADAKSERVSV